MADKVHLYDEFSGFYDLMVCWDNRLKNEAAFFKDLFEQHGVKRVVDAACGTGMHAILFAAWGYDVVGTDLSGEMVKIARANARRAKAKAAFVKAGFSQLGGKLSERFDAATCLGNSLPHVLSRQDMAQSLREIHKILSPGGIFVTQNRNYDKVWSEKNRFMPLDTATIDGKEMLFFRLLDFFEDSIGFNIVTFTKYEEKWSYTVNSTRHRPLFRDELATLLREAGFVDLQFFGDFQRQEFDIAKSADLIAFARKE